MGMFFIPQSWWQKSQSNSAYIVAFCLSKFHNHNGMMCIQSLAEHLVKWTQIWGGDGHLWVTWPSLLWASCLCEYVPRPMSAPCAWYCTAGSSSTLTMLSVCLHVITPFWHQPPSAFSCPFLSPSTRFSLAPHPSRCQALVHSTSPLAPWPGLPSNNFISFPPLSHWHAPPLTIGCCFLPEKKKKHRATQGRLRTQQ